MQTLPKVNSFQVVSLFFVAICILFMSSPVRADGYDDALKGVKNYDVIFDVSQGNPKIANLVFWAVKNAYEVDEVKAITKKPNVAVVFHGPVVKLLSSNRAPFDDAEWAEVEKFQATLRQMKKDGVNLEVCLYAAQVLGVDKETIIPEVDHVGNGFVSIAGYQLQGYAVVRIP